MKRLFLFFLIISFALTPFLGVRGDNYRTYDTHFLQYGQEVGEGTDHTIQYEGMVPCGRCLTADGSDPKTGLEGNFGCEGDEVYIPCHLCHLFIVFSNVISFVLVSLIPSLALIVIVFAGLLFMVKGNDPKSVQRATRAILYSAIGLFLAYFSWIIISILISSFMDWDIDWRWSGGQLQYECSVTYTEPDPD